MEIQKTLSTDTCAVNTLALCSAGLKVSCARRTTEIAGGNVMPSKFGVVTDPGKLSTQAVHADCQSPSWEFSAHCVATCPASQIDVPPHPELIPISLYFIDLGLDINVDIQCFFID